MRCIWALISCSCKFTGAVFPPPTQCYVPVSKAVALQNLDRTTERNRNGLSFEKDAADRDRDRRDRGRDERINVCGASDQTNNVRGCESAHSLGAPLSQPFTDNNIYLLADHGRVGGRGAGGGGVGVAAR